MKFLNFLLLSLYIVGCDSPMNHRTDEPKNLVQKANSLKLSKLELTFTTLWLVGPVGSINFNNKLLVSVYNLEGELTDLPTTLSLQFYATMPSMGHPMDDAGYFEKISTGLYLNSTIKYNMPGDWQNELWVMDENYQTLEAVQWLDYF